ncbi:MAG: acyltransferase, partial [Gemmatimonadaceae bacterium]
MSRGSESANSVEKSVASQTRRNSRLPFRPDIEGLRAIAVLLVIAFHSGIPGTTGGFVGVDVFFVISGFLITSLLIDEAERSGTISLPTFYARRIRRLFPAASAVLLATLAAAAVVQPPLQQLLTAASTRAAGFYLSNIHFARLASDYFSGDVKTDPVLHTWSLSVEEQFYLVWPCVILGVTRPWNADARLDRHRAGWALFVILALSFAAACWYSTANRSVA